MGSEFSQIRDISLSVRDGQGRCGSKWRSDVDCHFLFSNKAKKINRLLFYLYYFLNYSFRVTICYERECFSLDIIIMLN